jgi:vacuolar-type H+-ATPase subunit H
MYTKIILTFILITLSILLPIANRAVKTLSAYFKARVEEIQDKNIANAIQSATETVEQAVLYIMQTYVDSLKRSGSFTLEAQEEAFNTARDFAYEMINNKTRLAIAETYGSFSSWLNTKIEQVVRENKK